MAVCINHKLVKTRKPHQCLGCCYHFPKECHLFRSTTVDGNSIYSYYLCWSCEEAVSRCREDEFSEGDLYEETWAVLLDLCVNSKTICEDTNLDEIYARIIERCGLNLGTSCEHVFIVDELREHPEAGRIFVEMGLMYADENHRELRLNNNL